MSRPLPPAAERLRPEDSILVVVDVQERLLGHMEGATDVTREIARLARGADLLGVPVVATEQYVKGLGRTVPEVREALPPSTRVVEKTAFSCLGEAAFAQHLRAQERRSAIVCGIEAHVCVLQTSLDLLREGYIVHVVGNATASRSALNKDAGLARAREAGAVVSTTEMALFELMRTKDHARFKDVQALIK